MSHMLELAKDCKVAVVTMLRDIKEDVVIMKEHIISPKLNNVNNYIKYK